MFILISIIALKVITGEQDKKYDYTALKGETEFIFTDCLFQGFKNHAIYFSSSFQDDYELTINKTAFASCSAATGPAIYLDYCVNVIFKFVCVYQCTATSKYAIAYIKTNRDSDGHEISYLTAFDSTSGYQCFYFQNYNQNKIPLSITNSNISKCSTTT